MKHVLGKNNTIETQFMDETVEIKSLSISAVKGIRKVMATEEASMDNIDTLVYVIKQGVVGASEMSQDELESFPLQELSQLATEVLSHSGITAKDEGNSEGND